MGEGGSYLWTPVCVGFPFQVRFWVTVLALRSRVGRTLHDIYYPCFSPNVIVDLARRMGGHFVTPIKLGYIE